jgi:hypothetical protein
MTRRVLGGVTGRKRCENLTDEVPRRSGSKDLDTHRYKAKAEVRCEAAESAGRSLALAPWGLQRVRRRSPLLRRPRGYTYDRGMDEPHGRGPVSPRVSTAQGPPVLFREGHVGAKNRLNVMAAPDPQLVCSWRIACMLKVLPRTHREHSLTGRITLEGLYKAFKVVKRNRGAAGLDKQSIKMFEANVDENLLALMRELKSGTYQPLPLRRVYIPKGKGAGRPLGIPIAYSYCISSPGGLGIVLADHTRGPIDPGARSLRGSHTRDSRARPSVAMGHDTIGAQAETVAGGGDLTRGAATCRHLAPWHALTGTEPAEACTGALACARPRSARALAAPTRGHEAPLAPHRVSPLCTNRQLYIL